MGVIFKEIKEPKADYCKYYLGKTGQIVDTINFSESLPLSISFTGRRIISFVTKKTFIVRFKREIQDTTPPDTGAQPDIQELFLHEDEIEYENLLEL